MGEVYRARDTKLNRRGRDQDSSPGFCRDPERVARFKREAQVLASLNHPNIGAVSRRSKTMAGARGAQLVDGPSLAAAGGAEARPRG